MCIVYLFSLCYIISFRRAVLAHGLSPKQSLMAKLQYVFAFLSHTQVSNLAYGDIFTFEMLYHTVLNLPNINNLLLHINHPQSRD